MNNNIIVCIFVIFMIIFCLLWNKAMKKIYKNMNTQRTFKISALGTYINSFSELKLAGTKEDGNSDNKVINAIRQIQLPKELRIRKND